MKQDPIPIATGSDLPSRRLRATALYERVAATMDGIGSLRNTLLKLASARQESTKPTDKEELEEIWTRVEAAIKTLEEESNHVRALGHTLAASLVRDESEDAPIQSRSDSPLDLEGLIAQQRTALAGLNRQLAESETALRGPARSVRPSHESGDVELQDVNEFLRESPIASIPVNASYYQRILEASRAPEGHKRPMGSILLEAGLITTRQLDSALKYQRDGRKRPLGALLVDLGYTDDIAIAQTVAAQLALPYVSLSQETADREALDTIPLHLARRHACFPVSLIDGALYLAMANPLDLIALEDIRIASDRHIRPCVASREEITRHINRHYAGSSF
jgi:hypothetical protein